MDRSKSNILLSKLVNGCIAMWQ